MTEVAEDVETVEDAGDTGDAGDSADTGDATVAVGVAEAKDGDGTDGLDGAGGFGCTWWGRAWVDALEQRAQLDPNRLPRGRDYARDGAVGELALAPGEVRAQVQGRKLAPYEVRVRVRRFTDAEWDRVVEAVAAELGRTAALLDGDLPPEVVADVSAAGLDLLPGGGEVGPRCTCPDDADPCKHAAAVCYLVADALDADPFVLLLLRGRTQDEVLAALRARRRGEDPVRAAGSAGGLTAGAAGEVTAGTAGGLTAGAAGGPTAGAAGGAEAAVAAGAASVADGAGGGGGTDGTGMRAEAGGLGRHAGGGAVRDPGVDARAALGATPPSGPIPVPPMPPKRPGHPAALPVGPPPGRAELRDDLLALAADAAARAWELATGGARTDPVGAGTGAVGMDVAGLRLHPDADLARRADLTLGTPAFSRLAARSGIDARELARWGLAWRHGGAAGLDLLRNEWDPVAVPLADSEDDDVDAVLGAGDAGVAVGGGATPETELVDMLKAARVALREAAGATTTVIRNRISAGRLQLRLGRDYLWYPYARSDGDWEPAGPPQPDPVRAVAIL
jgi:uncharacterized Zn finger protein